MRAALRCIAALRCCAALLRCIAALHCFAALLRCATCAAPMPRAPACHKQPTCSLPVPSLTCTSSYPVFLPCPQRMGWPCCAACRCWRSSRCAAASSCPTPAWRTCRAWPACSGSTCGPASACGVRAGAPAGPPCLCWVAVLGSTLHASGSAALGWQLKPIAIHPLPSSPPTSRRGPGTPVAPGPAAGAQPQGLLRVSAYLLMLPPAAAITFSFTSLCWDMRGQGSASQLPLSSTQKETCRAPQAGGRWSGAAGRAALPHPAQPRLLLAGHGPRAGPPLRCGTGRCAAPCRTAGLPSLWLIGAASVCFPTLHPDATLQD